MQHHRSDSSAPAPDAPGVPQPDLPKPARKQCKASTKDGTACPAWAMPGGLCYFHANPDKASELGQRGGKAKSPTHATNATSYVARPLKTADDVTRLLADTINDLCSVAIDSRMANTVAYLAAGMLKALQQGDLEGRLRALEAVEGSRSKKSRSNAKLADPPAPMPSIYARLSAPKGD